MTDDHEKSVPEQSPLGAFLEWHAKEPNAIAVESYGEHDGQQVKLTVDDIYRRAVRLAQALLEEPGSKKDDIIGIQIELESELYVAFFACWMAGRTPTVMNVAWTPKIYENVISRLEIKTVLHTRLTPPSLPNLHALHTPSLGSTSALPTLPLSPEPYYALINQSSGTTGPPKSVPVRTAMYAYFCPRVTPGMAKKLRSASITAPSFSGVTAAIYLAPYVQSVCVYPGVARNGEKGYTAAEISDNVKLVLDKGVDTVGFTASLWTLFNSTLADEETFPSVKYASFGGELTPPHVLREARKRFPKAFVTVGFSSTESVQGGFGTAYGPDFDLENLTEIVVRPNQNITELLLLDNADKPVEMKNGATGRVAIVTAASADPYLIAPEGKRTAQDEKDTAAIVDTYRTTKDGKRMIVYGDRAIYRPDADGTPGIVVLGREGRRIKRNGVFIDLGAVDSLLLKALPETLGDASTMAAGKVLVCLITARPGSKGTLPDLEELNEVLARDTDVLLGMAVPIERTPIAVSGKKDWTALQGLADEAAAGEFAALPTLAKEDALARTISQHVADVLGEARLVNRDAPMTRVGMDSIGAARLLNILRKLEGGHRLRSDDVLTEDASVSRLATRMRGEGKVEEVMGQAYLDAEVERLAPQLKTLSGSSEKTTVKNVVLTGATGYLGSFILAELLLAYPDATIWCITRTGGLQRLLAALARTRVDIPAERIQAHVRAIQGDLGLPRLGLKKEDVARVKEADLILHNGALVHWTRPYKALLAPNVHSLLALLSMAAPHARLTFVSGGGQTALDEGNANAFADANGYTATKYVAEQLCARAGPNVKVLRPGYIIGEPVCNADDFLWRLLRVVVELGMYVQRKEGAAPMNAAPVRYVARLVIEPRAAVDRIWVQCTTDQFWDALIKEGYELKAVSDEEWERRLEEDLAQRGSEHPLVALAPFAHGLSNGLGYPRPEDLPREVIEESVMRGCVRYLRETGAIPNPDGSWVNVEEGRIGRTGR